MGVKKKLNHLTEVKIYLLYLAFSLIFPFVLNILFGSWPSGYAIPQFNWFQIGLVSLVLVLAPISWVLYFSQSGYILIDSKPSSYESILLGAVFVIGIFGYSRGISGWRYSNESVSESGGFGLYIFMLLPVVLRIYVLRYLFFYKPADLSLFAKCFLVVGLFVTINGNMTAIFALIHSILLLTNIKSILYVGAKNRTFKYLIFSVMVLGLVGFAYIIGESVKRSRDQSEVIDWVADSISDDSNWLNRLLLERITPSYVSFLNIGDQRVLQMSQDFDFFRIIKTSLFRLTHLTGTTDYFRLEKDLNGTVMRINYLMITLNPVNDREGTSPGLAPGFFYSFGLFWGLVTLYSYVLFTLWLTKRLLKRIPCQLSLFGCLMMLYLLLPLYESPLDQLLFDDGSFFLVLLLWTTLHRVESSNDGLAI